MPGASAGAMAGNTQMPPVAGAKAAMEETAERIREALESLPSYPQIEARVEMQITAEGLRIEMLDTGEDSFFDVGSANIRPDMVGVLQVITANVRQLPHKIAIEGHTDARPYGPGHPYSNWELSSERANAARRIMVAAGLSDTQLDALYGYGSSRLRYPDRPLDARNRRIAVVIRQAE
jgi:chemotaxis protein MotB